MAPNPERQVNPRWVFLAAVLALVVLAGGIAFALTRPDQTAVQPTPSPVTSSAAPSSATPEPEPTPTPTPTPSATPSREQTPYCAAFGRITASSVDGGDGEGGIDYEKLSKTFATLIADYSAAAKLAPDSLADDFDKVLDYLRQAKSAVDSRGRVRLLQMVKNLSSLNDAMSAIDAESRTLCG